MNAAYRLPAFPHAPHEGPPGTAKVQLRPIHPPYVRRLAGLLLALGTAGLIVAAELFATSAAPSGPANTPPGATRPIALDQRVCQEIGMTVDGFRGVSVRFAPSPRPSTVLAELREVTPAGELPIVRLTDVPIPPEGGPAWVRFAPITQSAGRRYRLDLSPSQSPAGVPAGQAPSVLVSRQNWYTGGRLMVGGREQWGDLVFTTDVEPTGLGAAWAGGRARSSAYCWSIAYHLALAWILWVAIGRGEDPAGGRGQNEKFVAIRALTGSLALVSLYVSPWSASSLPVIPDSVEYAVTAQRLALFGRYDVVIGGSSLPSIYPPGFPTLLSAVSAVAPAALGVGILVVLSSAVLAVLIAVRIGSRAAG
ncbi:MAG: hypothetical protein IMZ44_18490, partial [Planctomycetes bacterium]|nr:hypothetical protein [Planctomycetota bacterium]